MPNLDKGKAQKTNYRYPLFASAYVDNGFNGTKAAITAGYAEKTAYSQASRLLKNVEVQALISVYMAERVMSKDETAYRLSEHARADMRDMIGLTMDEIKNHPKAWLIKELSFDVVIPKPTRPSSVQDDENEETESLPESFVYVDRIKLHDAQAALNTIARHHGLLKDGVTINVNMDLVSQLVSALEAAGLNPTETLEKMLQKAQEHAAKPS